jgi:coenzyme F420-0:L-glutamate ligase/coenzyme F420-1:gamma-L-glutamate ligase
MAKSVTYFAVPGIPLVKPGDDLATMIGDAFKAAQFELMTGDIVVIAQKIISKSEGWDWPAAECLKSAAQLSVVQKGESAA